MPADADCSAFAALAWVTLSIRLTAVLICSMPWACSSLAADTSPDTATPFSELACDSEMNEVVDSVASAPPGEMVLAIRTGIRYVYANISLLSLRVEEGRE